MDTIIRFMIADYLNVGTAAAPKWALMGTGFTTLDENPNAQVDTRAYVHNRNSTSTVRGYQTEFPYDADMIADEKAVMALYKTGRNKLTGAAAEFDYIRVDMFDADTGALPANTKVFPARKFRVTNVVTGNTGAGTEIVALAGSLNAVGDPVFGTMNLSDAVNPVFTPDTEETEG